MNVRMSLLPILVLFCTTVFAAVEPPALNLDFSRKGSDGQFMHWRSRGAAAEFRAENGVLTISPNVPEDTKLLIQSPLLLQAGGKYRFSYECRGDAGMKAAAYIEYRNASDKLASINGSLKPVTAEWTKHAVEFVMPEDFAGPYMVIMLGPGTGTCQFRGLALEDTVAHGKDKKLTMPKPAQSISAEQCFPTPFDGGPWRKIGGKGSSAEFSGGTLKLRLNAREGTVFYLKPLALRGGRRYEFASRVRLGGGRYAFYLEYTRPDGGRPSVNGTFFPANGTGFFPVSFADALPENASNVVLVLAAQDAPEAVEFADVTIRELVAEVRPSDLNCWRGGLLEAQPDGRKRLLVPDGAVISIAAVMRKGQFYRFGFDGATVKSSTVTGFASFQFRAKAGGRVVFASDWDDLMNNAGSSKELIFQADEDGEGTLEIESRGEIALKAVRLEEIVPAQASPVELTLLSPAYRNTMLDSRRQDICGMLALKQAAVSADIRLASASAPEQSLMHVMSKGGAFSLPGSGGLPVGEYRLTIVPKDGNGKAFPELNTVIHVLREPRICYQYNPRDNTFTLNGKPVHFHGIMHGYVPELAWLYRYYGVTTFAVLAPDSRQLVRELDKAQALGFRLLLNMRADYYRKEKSDFLEEWKRYMAAMLTPQVLAHPALAGYISADEPAWCDFPFTALEAITEFIHSIDPTRPLWINEAPRGSVEINRRIAAQADAFGVDIYPVPYPNGHSGLDDKTITAVGAYTRRCREAAGPTKPIWMVLQGFAWNDLNHRPNPVYPTAAECRFMALQAMVNGANADIYYGVNSIRNAAFYLDMLKTISEVGMLSRLWQVGHSLDIQAAPGMKLFAGTVDGERFIVALNTTSHSLDSGLELNGLYELPGGKPASDSRFEKYTARVFASVPRYPGDFTPRPPYDKAREEQALAFLNRMFAPTAPYQGKAQWIWYPGDAKALVCSSTLALDFSLNASPLKAQLLVAADDEGFVTLNGRRLGKAGGWSTMENYPVASLLKAGKNRLEVQVASVGAPPSGLLAELTVDFADGSCQKFVSGPDWTAVKPGVPVKHAEVIAPYGGGAWGTKVEFYR